MVSDERETHPLKALLPMEDTDAGIEMVSNAEQSANAPKLMETT